MMASLFQSRMFARSQASGADEVRRRQRVLVGCSMSVLVLAVACDNGTRSKLGGRRTQRLVQRQRNAYPNLHVGSEPGLEHHVVELQHQRVVGRHRRGDLEQ